MNRKLTYYDKLVGLAFHPQYRKEHKKLFPSFSSSSQSLEAIFNYGGEIEDFKMRWGLKFIVDPEDVECRIGKGINKNVGGGVFLDYYETVKVIPHRKSWHGQQLDFSRQLRNEKYLTLQIDITADERVILEAVKDYVNFYRKITKFRSTKRAKPSKGDLDHWVVYKKRHSEKKSFLQITRDLFGEIGQPAYDSIADSYNKRVKRAYQKADEIISQIKPVTK